MAEHRTRRRRRPGVVVLVPLALLASSAVVYQASNAAFTASTSNANNQWTSGSVAITDNDGGTVMFNVGAVKPAQTGSKCIVVTYSGSLAANIKFYVTNYSSPATGTAPSGLGPYLNFTVEQGTGATGGATGDCTGFSAGSTLTGANETLAGLAGASNSWANGLAAWNPAGTGESRSYRITWTMQDTTGTNAQSQSSLDNAQGASASAGLTWEARNS